MPCELIQWIIEMWTNVENEMRDDNDLCVALTKREKWEKYEHRFWLLCLLFVHASVCASFQVHPKQYIIEKRDKHLLRFYRHSPKWNVIKLFDCGLFKSETHTFACHTTKKLEAFGGKCSKYLGKKWQNNVLIAWYIRRKLTVHYTSSN